MLSLRKRFRYRLEVLGLTFAAAMIPRLPRNICLRLARFLGAAMAIFDRRARRVALSNLEVSLGSQLTRTERQRVARESFQQFARTMIDLLWSPRLSAQNLQHYCDIVNFDEAISDLGAERNVIIVGCHYGNFEWLGLACGFLGLKGTIPAEEFKNPQLEPIFRKLREQSGHELIPRERGLIRIYKVLRRKGRTAFLVDLTIPPTEGAVAIECFGLKTSVTSAHAWLHQQTGAPILPTFCQPLADGRYRLTFHRKVATTPTMTRREIAQACWDVFEPYIRKEPAPWLWMYKHWRYKPMSSDRPYPFYAQTWKAFERIVAGEDAPRRAFPHRLTTAPGDSPVP